MDGGWWYPKPHISMTADCVIFGFDGSGLKGLLIQRRSYPYEEHWALPGGFMDIEETIEQCAERELREETGLSGIPMHKFNVYTKVTRDPRERVVTVAFFALAKITEVKGDTDAKKAEWKSVDDLPGLAFDHDQIVKDALNALRERMHFDPIGFELLPEVFTMPQLLKLYEVILGEKFDRRNFAKKIKKLGIVEEVRSRGSEVASAGGRVWRKYRFIKGMYDQLKNTKKSRHEF